MNSDFIPAAAIVLGKEPQYPLIRNFGGARNNLLLLPGAADWLICSETTIIKMIIKLTIVLLLLLLLQLLLIIMLSNAILCPCRQICAATWRLCYAHGAEAMHETQNWLLGYQLIYPVSSVLLEKPIGPQPAKKFVHFMEHKSSLPWLQDLNHMSLSSASWVALMSPYPIHFISILIFYSHLGLVLQKVCIHFS